MPYPSYLTEEKLEDFRLEEAHETLYASEQGARFRRIGRAIDQCVAGEIPVPQALALLAADYAIEPIALNKDGRKTMTREEKIAWARGVIREAFTETILDIETRNGVEGING